MYSSLLQQKTIINGDGEIARPPSYLVSDTFIMINRKRRKASERSVTTNLPRISDAVPSQAPSDQFFLPIDSFTGFFDKRIGINSRFLKAVAH